MKKTRQQLTLAKIAKVAHWPELVKLLGATIINQLEEAVSSTAGMQGEDPL